MAGGITKPSSHSGPVEDGGGKAIAVGFVCMHAVGVMVVVGAGGVYTWRKSNKKDWVVGEGEVCVRWRRADKNE
jgi:hypothetical protein